MDPWEDFMLDMVEKSSLFDDESDTTMKENQPIQAAAGTVAQGSIDVDYFFANTLPQADISLEEDPFDFDKYFPSFVPSNDVAITCHCEQSTMPPHPASVAQSPHRVIMRNVAPVPVMHQFLVASHIIVPAACPTVLAAKKRRGTTRSSKPSRTVVKAPPSSNYLFPMRVPRLRKCSVAHIPTFTCGRGHTWDTKHLLLNDLASNELFCCPHPDCKFYSYSTRNVKVAKTRNELGTCQNGHTFLLCKTLKSAKDCPYCDCPILQICNQCNGKFNVEKFGVHKCGSKL